MSEWISVEERLPPIKERFTDVNYHGEVEGWFAQYYKRNARHTCLWTSDKGQRWMVSSADGYGPAKEPPTHWRPNPDPPITLEKGQATND